MTLLRRVPWAVYERLRASRANGHLRMFYDGGDLYLMSPSLRHESTSRLIGSMIHLWAIEKKVRLHAAGGATQQRKKKKYGLEPDESYYLTRIETLKPGEDRSGEPPPPPDLVLEVDVSRYSTRKLPRYAQLGVREVWLWRDGIKVFVLQGDQYVLQTESALLPGFPVAAASRIVIERSAKDLTDLSVEWLTLIRAG